MIDERPTQVRHFVIASAWLMSLLLYLDRFCISVAQSYIQEDLGLTDKQVGWMLSAFFWTYALGQVPSGWFSDRFGARIMLTSYILLWSLCTGLTGAATSFLFVLLLRLGFGLAQAGAYPTAAIIVRRWVPVYRRGLANGLIAVGGRVGGTLAMLATGYLLVWLTPVSTPTALTADDLLDAPRLCYELVDDTQPAAGVVRLRQRFFAALSTSGQMVVRTLADRHQAQPDVRTASPSAEELTSLVAALNEVLAGPAWFGPGDLAGVSVESEARRLMLKEPAGLSPPQAARLNRLVLEASHRGAVRRLYGVGWRPMMWLYASLGVFVAAWVWQTCRNSPRDHPRCNAAEVELIEGSDPLPASTSRISVPVRPLLLSINMWLCCLAQWFTNMGWVFLMTLAPRYFTNVHQASIEEVGLYTAIPPIVGWFGMISGGTLTDVLGRRLGRRWGRVWPLALSRFLAMSAYLLCLVQPSPVLAVVLFSLVAFATDLGTPSVWAFSQDIGGRNVGSVLGWGNMWGNFGAAVTPPLLLWLVGTAERWQYAFLMCAAAFFLAGMSALGMNGSIPLIPASDEDARTGAATA